MVARCLVAPYEQPRSTQVIQVWREEKDGEVENMKERERLLKRQISYRVQALLTRES
jgi:hypothetical protein